MADYTVTRAGTRLKQLRLAKGLNQEEVARYIGKKKAAISKYENHQRQIKESDMIKLGELFGVHPGYFVDSIEDKEGDT